MVVERCDEGTAITEWNFMATIEVFCLFSSHSLHFLFMQCGHSIHFLDLFRGMGDHSSKSLNAA
jgi:hypothetical protein